MSGRIRQVDGAGSRVEVTHLMRFLRLRIEIRPESIFSRLSKMGKRANPQPRETAGKQIFSFVVIKMKKNRDIAIGSK
jgi:hypothetical protein